MNEPGDNAPAQDPRTAAAALIAPDPETAELIKKHAAKEKLTPQQYGKLGAFARLKNMLGISEPRVEPGAAGTGHQPRLDSSAPAQAPNDGLPDPGLDASVAERTTGAVLKRLEAILRRRTEIAARRCDPTATLEEVKRLGAASGLSADDKALVIELSPDALRELGVNPRKYPLAVWLAVLGGWLTHWWLDLNDFERRAAERQRTAAAVTDQEKPARSATPFPVAGSRDDGSGVARPQQHFEPSGPPPGAPPTVTGPQPPVIL